MDLIGGVEKLLSVGVYPEVSLKKARRCEAIHEEVECGISPSRQRKAEKRARQQLYKWCICPTARGSGIVTRQPLAAAR